jgi:hypothetical protein
VCRGGVKDSGSIIAWLIKIWIILLIESIT